MLCDTLKAGVECFFMTKEGCSYNGGRCHGIVEACEGCSRVRSFPAGKFCESYANPAAKWLSGRCSLATNVNGNAKKESRALNPLKASKRSAAGRRKGR